MCETHFSIPCSWSPPHLLFMTVPPRPNERSQILEAQDSGTEVKSDKCCSSLLPWLQLLLCLSCPWSSPLPFISDSDLSCPSLLACVPSRCILGACCRDVRHGKGGGCVFLGFGFGASLSTLTLAQGSLCRRGHSCWTSPRQVLNWRNSRVFLVKQKQKRFSFLSKTQKLEGRVSRQPVSQCPPVDQSADQEAWGHITLQNFRTLSRRPRHWIDKAVSSGWEKCRMSRMCYF